MWERKCDFKGKETESGPGCNGDAQKPGPPSVSAFGMNVRYRVELTQYERNELLALLSGGKHNAWRR
jgi:hypothetical protein